MRAPFPARPPLPVRLRYLRMEPRLHRHRRACSAHRRRVEAPGLLLEIDIGERLAVGISDGKARSLAPRQTRAAGGGDGSISSAGNSDFTPPLHQASTCFQDHPRPRSCPCIVKKYRGIERSVSSRSVISVAIWLCTCPNPPPPHASLLARSDFSLCPNAATGPGAINRAEPF